MVQRQAMTSRESVWTDHAGAKGGVMYGKPIVVIEGAQAKPPTAREALDALGLARNMVHFDNADQALGRLRGERAWEPAVIVLDGLPDGPNGLDALKILKSDETLRAIPVIVVTPSGDAQVVDESFARGAAGFVVKPASRSEFIETMRAIHEYWTLSEVPPGMQSVRCWLGT